MSQDDYPGMTQEAYRKVKLSFRQAAKVMIDSWIEQYHLQSIPDNARTALMIEIGDAMQESCHKVAMMLDDTDQGTKQ